MSPVHKMRAWYHRLEPLERTIIKLGVLAGSALVVVIALVVALLALSTADSATKFAQADCQAWRDVALIEPAPTSSSAGLQLFADFRVAYANKGCVSVLGPLPAADPRIAKLLPPGVH